MGTDSMVADTKARQPSLVVVYLTVFIDILGFGIILPSLPYYARELGASGLGLGALLTSYSLAQLCAAPVLGRLSDRFGRRPVLLLSLAGSAISMVLSGLAQSLLFLSLARALAGLFGGSIATAQAYVADVTSPEERPKYMGLVGASIGLGFVLGPALGVGVLALGYGFAGSAYAAACLAAANGIFAFFKLREPERSRVERPRTSLAMAFEHRDLVKIFAATFLGTFTFVSMETTFAFLGKDRFGLDEQGFGLTLVFAGVLVVIVQGGLIGRLTARFGVRPVAVSGALIMGIAMLGVGLAPALMLAVAAVGLLAAGQGLVSPSLSSLNSTISGVDEQGAHLGLAQSFAAAARAIGPVAAGALYDLGRGAPYFCGGAAALVAAVLISRVRTRS